MKTFKVSRSLYNPDIDKSILLSATITAQSMEMVLLTLAAMDNKDLECINVVVEQIGESDVEAPTEN